MRLIDADELRTKACHAKDIAKQDGELMVIGLGYLYGAPTIDPESLRAHGKWKDKVNPNWRAYSHLECSNCGWWNTRNATVVKGKVILNFCPNCGCDMREKGEIRK